MPDLSADVAFSLERTGICGFPGLPGPPNQQFVDDDADTTLPNTATFPAGPCDYDLRLSVAPGWRTVGISCTASGVGTAAHVEAATKSVYVELPADGIVVCRFVVQPQPLPTATQVTIPDALGDVTPGTADITSVAAVTGADPAHPELGPALRLRVELADVCGVLDPLACVAVGVHAVARFDTDLNPFTGGQRGAEVVAIHRDAVADVYRWGDLGGGFAGWGFVATVPAGSAPGAWLFSVPQSALGTSTLAFAVETAFGDAVNNSPSRPYFVYDRAPDADAVGIAFSPAP